MVTSRTQTHEQQAESKISCVSAHESWHRAKVAADPWAAPRPNCLHHGLAPRTASALATDNDGHAMPLENAHEKPPKIHLWHLIRVENSYYRHSLFWVFGRKHFKFQVCFCQKTTNKTCLRSRGRLPHGQRCNFLSSSSICTTITSMLTPDACH